MLEDMPGFGSGVVHKHNASKDDHTTDGPKQIDAALKGRTCYVNDLRALELNNLWGIRYHTLDQVLPEIARDPKWCINLIATTDPIDLALNKHNNPYQTQIWRPAHRKSPLRPGSQP